MDEEGITVNAGTKQRSVQIMDSFKILLCPLCLVITDHHCFHSSLLCTRDIMSLEARSCPLPIRNDHFRVEVKTSSDNPEKSASDETTKGSIIVGGIVSRM